MAVNWGLAQGGGAAENALQLGAQYGQQLRQRRDEERFSNALSGLVSNPQADEAQFLEWTKGLPGQQVMQLAQLRGQYQQQAAQGQRAQVEQRRADLPLLTKLLEGSTDETSYQNARATAQQYGIDLSNAPANYDANWVTQQRTTLQMLQTPQGQQALSNAGKQAQDMGYRPGTAEFNQIVNQIVTADVAIPYTDAQGNTRLFQPKIGLVGTPESQNPPVGHIEEGYRFKGGDPSNPSNWEAVMNNEQGGAALQAAYETRTITAEEAARVRQSLGPNGAAKFNQWLRDNNITIGAR